MLASNPTPVPLKMARMNLVPATARQPASTRAARGMSATCKARVEIFQYMPMVLGSRWSRMKVGVVSVMPAASATQSSWGGVLP